MVHLLWGLDAPGRFSSILYEGDNFCNFLFVDLHTKLLRNQKSTLKGKKLLPRGATSYL